MRPARSYWVRLLLASTAVLLLAACATFERAAPFAAQGGAAWPGPPDPPRLQYVTQFSGTADLGIRPSAWSRIVSFVSGPGDRAMQRPMAVAATPAGDTVFVADPGAGVVHRYDLVRGRYDRLTPGRGTALASPVGLAVTADGRVFVADSALNAVLSAGPEDDALQPLALTPEPEQPTGLALGPSGDLFVASTGSHTIRRYSAAGTLLREYGGRGSAPGQLNFPTYLWLESPSELLVTDTLNFRIQRFDADNGVLGAFGQAGDASGSLARPKGVAVDRHGNIYVMDGVLNALQVFDREGRLLLAFGEQGQGPGQFWLPSGIFVTPDDLVFVADSYNRRVQVFRYLGDTP